jgi:hypothetical protein
VLDAIWDKVDAKPERSGSAETLFRSKALKQLDVAAEVDNQLPLVSRRNWLLLVGVAFLVAAVVLWASLTPSVTRIDTTGLIVAPPGVTTVVAPVSGVLLVRHAEAGEPLQVGDPVVVLRTEEAEVTVQTLVSGTVWQVEAITGDAVQAGETLVTVLPPGSDATAMLVAPAVAAVEVAPGMSVDVVAGGRVTGEVATVSAPMSAEEAGRRTGQALDPTSNYVMLTVDLSRPVPSGRPATGIVITSEGTVLTRLVDRT